MAEPNPLELRRLERADIPQFEGFTYPAYRKRLRAGEPMVAMGASFGKAPVGLALAGAPKDGRAEALSLFVAQGFRNQGLGTILLNSLENALMSEGIHVATCTYVVDGEMSHGVEKVLAKAGWAPPIPRMLMFQGDLHTLQAAHWLQNIALTPEYAIVPWVDIQPSERENLRLWQQVEPWIPEDLEPSLHEEGYDKETSLALLLNGRLVGWVLTHRLDATLLRFSSGWVHPSVQRRGRLFALYAASGERAIALGYERASWAVPLHHEAKAAFARRWMAPVARGRETRGSVKLLLSLQDA